MMTDLDSCGEVQTNQNLTKLENEKQLKQLQRKCVSPPSPTKLLAVAFNRIEDALQLFET
jgi:hypothetical protein